jgi:hypothetical protein
MFVKGTAIRSVLLALEKIAGRSGFDRVIRRIPPAHRVQIEPSVLASCQYPVDIAASLHMAIAIELGDSGYLVNHRIGIAAARVDYGTVYRAILRAVVDIDSLLEKVGLNWKQYNSQGHVIWRERRAGFVRGEIRAVVGYNEPMWWSVAGRIEELLRMCGAKSAVVRPTRSEETECDLEARWSSP